jgi:hypothetical protein
MHLHKEVPGADSDVCNTRRNRCNSCNRSVAAGRLRVEDRVWQLLQVWCGLMLLLVCQRPEIYVVEVFRKLSERLHLCVGEGGGGEGGEGEGKGEGEGEGEGEGGSE